MICPPWKVRAREDELQFHLKHENVVVGGGGEGVELLAK